MYGSLRGAARKGGPYRDRTPHRQSRQLESYSEQLNHAISRLIASRRADFLTRKPIGLRWTRAWDFEAERNHNRYEFLDLA